MNLIRANVNHVLRPIGDVRQRIPDDFDPPAYDPPPAATGPSTEWEKAYAALEISYGSGVDDIKSAHRRLLRRFHPDRFAQDQERLPDATRLSQQLTEARDVLLGAIEKGVLIPTR